MPFVDADGTKLYYEEAGAGYPVVFVHEFAGDLRSWEPQLRALSRRYRCIAYNARGYPPSDVPDDVACYGQAIAVADLHAVMHHLGIERAHLVGLSMGAFAVLHFGLHHAEMASALVVAGCGYGSMPADRARMARESLVLADRFEAAGSGIVTEAHAIGPTHVQYLHKDPRGWAEFGRDLAAHSARGSALTLRGVQAARPGLTELEEDLRGLSVPTLLIAGDEDTPAIAANLYLKDTIPASGLLLLPKSGHTVNLEEPALFNAAVEDFLARVEHGRWAPRDPRSLSPAMLPAGAPDGEGG